MSLDYCAEHGVHEDPGCAGCRAFMDAPARGMALPAVPVGKTLPPVDEGRRSS